LLSWRAPLLLSQPIPWGLIFVTPAAGCLSILGAPKEAFAMQFFPQDTPPTQTVDRITFAEARTLPGLFEERCRRSPNGEAYRQFDPVTQHWHSSTWSDMRARVEQFRAAIAREDLPHGERVAVMLKNSMEWASYDLAAQSLGLVVVPLYPTDNAENIAYILGDCGARVLLLGESQRWEALRPHQDKMPQLRRVVSVEAGAADDGVLRPLRSWLQGASPVPPAPEADTDALATIVYTSGTTGKPKGVMLSHRNILANIDAVLQTIDVFREDILLSFLPLSHTLERTVGYYLPIVTGSTVAFARSVQDLAEDLLTVRPTLLVSVPRVYERVYAKLQQGLEEKGAPARKLFEIAESSGWRRFEAAQHRGPEPGTLTELMWPVLRHLVADKLVSRLGGRLRIAVSGGAPVSTKLMHTFLGLGLPILQGYGLTETAPIVAANRLEDNVPESVGKPVPGVEVKLGERDELLVRGPNVMLGYWNDPVKTRDTFTPDGWLRTGDIGRLDDEGRVYIVGRLKEILVTSTGEKVPPADIELAITEDPLFEQAMVLGEGRPFVSALLVLSADGWKELASDLRIDPADREAVHRPEVHEAVLEHLRARLAAFPSYARVRGVWLTLDPWTVDNGLITPTMKLRRKQLEQRFAEEIRQIYAARPAAA
jgi:long-chain acyl-CoA synthetase